MDNIIIYEAIDSIKNLRKKRKEVVGCSKAEYAKANDRIKLEFFFKILNFTEFSYQYE